MRKIIYLFIALAVIFIANVSMAQSTNKSYRFDLSNSTDGLVQSNLLVLRMQAIVDGSPKEARATLYSFAGEELTATNFNLPVGSNKVIIDVPHYDLGKEIKITSNNTSKEQLLVIDVSPFSKTCDDGTCQAHESYFSCPTDCASGGQDNYCDSVKDDVCDPDCNPTRLDPDCLDGGQPFVTKPAVDTTVSKLKDTSTEETEKAVIDTTKNAENGKKPNIFLVIGFGVVILVVLISIVVSRMRKNDNPL